MTRKLLSVDSLKVHFKVGGGLFGTRKVVHAVDGVSFDVPAGGSFGIVGESGSGKTTTALAIMRLVAITLGRIELDGVDVGALQGEALRQMRARFQIVFQDPYSSLNPRMQVGKIVREPLDLMNIATPEQRDARVVELFEELGLRPEHRFLFPHQFSGGQRQRIGLARALSTKPDLLVFDEPVSALDVAVQAQILNLLHRLQDEHGLTYLFISHDLAVVQHVCQEIAVMYLGQIVEQASRRELFRNPLHPYTKGLLAAVPVMETSSPDKRARLRIAGDPPSPINPPKGCRFAGRCPLAVERCHEEPPALRNWSEAHRVACHLVGD